MSFRQDISNFLGYAFGGSKGGASQAFVRNGGGTNNASRNLNMEIFPNSLTLAKADLGSWVAARAQADLASYPYRVQMQKMYEKTLQNPHVAACIQRRMELTLLRDFEIVNANGERDKEWTEYFKKAWYTQHAMPLMLWSDYHGFTLASIGGIKDGVPDLITNIKRWNISPEREIVSQFESSPSGWSWNDDPWKDWHVWMPTVQTNGQNNCGYGMLYIITFLAILQQNNMAYNTDFIEMFAQPYRHLKTADLEGEEFEEKKKALANMGHMGALITGLNDELEFLNDGSRGNGYKAYNDFDHRCKADISKYIGGHADFIDGTTKNGAGDKQNSGGGDITDDATGNGQVQKAIAAKRMIDGDMVTMRTNELWIPKLRNLGVSIPAGHKIHFLNDTEERSISQQEAGKNQQWATLALTMAQGGLKMDGDFFTKTTGVPCSDIEVMPDKNVMKDPKEQAAGKGSLKDKNKSRPDKPKHT